MIKDLLEYRLGKLDIGDPTWRTLHGIYYMENTTWKTSPGNMTWTARAENQPYLENAISKIPSREDSSGEIGE